MITNRKHCIIVGAWMALATSCSAQPLIDGQSLQIGHNEFRVQAPPGDGPVVLTDPTTIRFTVEPGDEWSHDARSGKVKERAEISGQDKIAYGDLAEASVELRIKAQKGEGPGRWMTISQLHGPNMGTLKENSPLRSPVLAVQLRDDMLVFVVRSGGEDDSHAKAERIAFLPADFGEWHRYDMRVQMGAPGFVEVFRDGELVANWKGPVGYDAGDRQHYWKFGVYRSGGWTQRSEVDVRIACAGRGDGCEAQAQ